MRGTNALLPAGGFDVDRLLAPEQAIVAYFARAQLREPRVERVALANAFGHVLAQPVTADADYPSGPRSTMDGFAVRSAMTPGAFEIRGEIRMGSEWMGGLDAHATVRIPTGGLLPDELDAVVPIEDARLDGERVVVDRAVPANDCVLQRGSDMRAGSTILQSRRFIGAAELGVLATLGITAVPVYRRPRVAVISSGDELVDPSAAPAPGQIRDSNRWAIEGALRAFGADVLHLPIVPDEIGAAAGTLREALAVCDGVILTGGSSVGTRDLTPQMIDCLGEPGVIVHGLRVKPGKPTVFGAVDGKPIIGLPGNPASALIILIAVAEPIIAALVGAQRPSAVVSGILAKPFAKRAGWTWFVPVTIDETGKEAVIQPMEMHSGSVSLLARADGFSRFDEAVASLPAGSAVRAVRFFRGGL